MLACDDGGGGGGGSGVFEIAITEGSFLSS